MDCGTFEVGQIAFLASLNVSQYLCRERGLKVACTPENGANFAIYKCILIPNDHI